MNHKPSGLTCPQCNNRLYLVRKHPMRAGDYYCIKCPGNKSFTGFKYYRKSELL